MVELSQIAQKWQKCWEEAKIFKVKEDPKKKKFYCLEMFPYPSGSGLHMGHVRNYALGDAYARYKRMQGFNVLYPMGYDAFGLPAENAAIKNKEDPKKWTEANMQLMKTQQKMLGLSYDWGREVATCYDTYYRWNQWIFLQLYEKGLAYKKKASANWCHSCNTVLANEQVVEGRCWRCHNEVSQKELEQWFFRITAYADELLQDIGKLQNWPERVRIMQRNWIGRSEGAIVKFKLIANFGQLDKSFAPFVEVFTTRPDTLFGATFVAVSAALAKQWLDSGLQASEKREKISRYVQETLEDEKRLLREDYEKTGIFAGVYAVNPVNDEKIPVWVVNYVLAEVGTGAVMAVPAHDQRDFEFARKYKLPIRVVIKPEGKKLDENLKEAYVGEGVLVNSGKFNGLSGQDGRRKITEWLKGKGLGNFSVQYKLRDWLISRQRFWGTPIPMVYCAGCGLVPVNEKDLPVKLPDPSKIRFTGEGNPLDHCREFVETKCPKCNKKARRETDTMDTFVDSSWYFLRYCSPKEEKLPFSKDAVKYWMPVEQYIGGIEHAVMHLLYARFFTKALRDLGLLNFDEPFTNLLCQGMVLKDGAVMSKSRGNVVDPRDIIKLYGPDTARLFILFVSLPEKELEWSDDGIQGTFRFLGRVYNLLENVSYKKDKELDNSDKKIISYLHYTIKDVTELTEQFKFSLAIGSIMKFVHELNQYKEKGVQKETYLDAVENLVLLLTPFVPHLAEEMWEKLGKKPFVSLAKWPEYDETKIDKEAVASEAVVSKTIADINAVLKLIKIGKPKKITLIVASGWQYLFFKILKEEIKKTRDIRALITVCIDEKDLKPYAQEIARLVPALLKDPSKFPETLLTQQKEFLALKDTQDTLSKEFSCAISIVKADESKEQKARQALPGKPAIVVE